MSAWARSSHVALALTLLLLAPPFVAAQDVTPSAPSQPVTRLPATRWQVVVGQRVEAGPVAAGDRLYLATDDGTIVGLDAATGSELWRLAAGGSPGPLAVADGTLYVPALGDDEALHAIDAATGRERWHQTIASGLLSAAAVAGGTVYAVGGTIQGGALFAWDATTGDPLWRFPLDGPVAYTVDVADGTAYVAAGKAIVAVDAAHGTARWSTDVGEWVAATAAGEGRVYGTTLDGTLLALNAATGDVQWTFRPGFQGDQLHMWNGAPVVLAGVVYAPSTQGLYALEAETGAPRWHAGLGWIGGLAIVEGIVYATTDIAPLAALDAATGVPLWQLRPGGPAVGTLAVAAGRMYVGGLDGVVYAFDLGAGPVRPASGPGQPTFPTRDQLLLLGELRGVPPAPAYVGLWRFTYAPGAVLPPPAFPGPALAYLAGGDLGWTGDKWGSGQLRNDGTAPAVLLVAAIVPAAAVPLHLAQPGLTVALLGGGVAAELPSGGAMVTLTRRVYQAGATTPPELTVWPEVLAVESGKVAMEVAETPATVMGPGDGVLVPGGSVWVAGEANQADRWPGPALVAGCGGSRVAAPDNAAAPVASPGPGPAAKAPGFVVLDLAIWSDFELGMCAASPPDFAFGPAGTPTP
jgi:outer membrane protein assembly factor BamB